MKSLCKLMLITLSLIYLGACCTTNEVEYKYVIYTPVYKNIDDVRNAIKSSPAKELKNTGKIYFYGNYILINEKNEGIHIIDNSNPSSPSNLAFIEIPGNGDMAVRNNILFADSYIDMVALDISNPSQPVLKKRIENIFPNLLNIDRIGYLDKEKGLLVDYIQKDTIIKYTYKDCSGTNDYSPVGDVKSGGTREGAFNDAQNSGGSQTGKGGSMARFTIYDRYLYSVDGNSLQVFDITTASDPKVWSKVNIGWNIETIYPFKNRLFIGSMTGMYIYDVSSSWDPVLLGEFHHARACDPVVADDNYAYVTLRTGTNCGGNQNQLDIIDIKDLSNPKLIKSYPMQGPLGLGLDKNILFICDGNAGLKIFDVEKPKDIMLLDWKSDINTYDVIPLGKSLLMIGADGLFQYDYANPKDLKLLSKIPIVK